MQNKKCLNEEANFCLFSVSAQDHIQIMKRCHPVVSKSYTCLTKSNFSPGQKLLSQQYNIYALQSPSDLSAKWNLIMSCYVQVNWELLKLILLWYLPDTFLQSVRSELCHGFPPCDDSRVCYMCNNHASNSIKAEDTGMAVIWSSNSMTPVRDRSG